MQSNPTTLISAAWPGTERFAAVRAILLVIAGSLLLTICAKIQVPMWPVQMSMQTFGVLLIGAAWGPIQHRQQRLRIGPAFRWFSRRHVSWSIWIVVDRSSSSIHPACTRGTIIPQPSVYCMTVKTMVL